MWGRQADVLTSGCSSTGGQWSEVKQPPLHWQSMPGVYTILWTGITYAMVLDHQPHLHQRLVLEPICIRSQPRPTKWRQRVNASCLQFTIFQVGHQSQSWLVKFGDRCLCVYLATQDSMHALLKNHRFSLRTHAVVIVHQGTQNTQTTINFLLHNNTIIVTCTVYNWE